MTDVPVLSVRRHSFSSGIVVQGMRWHMGQVRASMIEIGEARGHMLRFAVISSAQFLSRQR